MAGAMLLGTHSALQTAVAEGDTRTLSFHHLHTGEDITITFKRDGRYDDAALKKLDWFMRDWRREESTSMDPHLFDLLWEAYREVDGSAPIQVVCGYRSPETNSMLRARSTGVAQLSQHTQGHAMDFFIPGVALDKLRAVGLRLQRGGVGFYPTSGSPFVHMDTGSVRHWPRMTHDQLVKVFPDGRTVHVPSDGVPLSGYALALADVKARGNEPSATSLAAARDNGIDAAAAPKRSLFAALFGGRSKDADEVSEEPAPKAASLRAPAPVALASLTPPKPVAVEKIVPLPIARPKIAPVAVAALTPKPAAPVMVTAALTPATVFDTRGSWRGAIESGDLPAAQAQAMASPFEVASADGSVVASTQAALAYAPAETPAAAPAKIIRPMGTTTPRIQAVSPANTTVAMERPALRPSFSAPAPLTSGSQSFDSVWMRAAMLTPSVGSFMRATQVGSFDPKPLRVLMQKPAQALAMTFSADPQSGMVAERFTGSAVVFLATATFVTQKTASLR